jgi:hypothetical protein
MPIIRRALSRNPRVTGSSAVVVANGLKDESDADVCARSKAILIPYVSPVSFKVSSSMCALVEVKAGWRYRPFSGKNGTKQISCGSADRHTLLFIILRGIEWVILA